ncbi:pentapeptide repeat-containing protein [Nitrospira sp. Nam80]
MFLAVPSLLWPGEVSSPCREEKSKTGAGKAFIRHLDKACSKQEREARAIQAGHIMEALKKGRSVDLSGVIIIGDLVLNDLPIKSLAKVLPALSSDDRQIVERLNAEAIRLVDGTVSIRDSDVRGRIINRTKEDMLVISGSVILSGTHFEDVVDLSRTVFLGVVDCSSATFSKETYFVQGRFQQPALFTQASFGPHTRFHRSVFGGVANFYHAHFNGLAEFLEVSFEQGASFSGAQFLSGTGFSGSRFNGTGDFLDAQFEGDVYFLFTRFEKEGRFRGTTFQTVADFSDAVFTDGQDLEQAVFSRAPRLPGSIKAEVSTPATPPTWMEQYGVTGALLVGSLLLLGWLFKIK